MAGGVVNPNEFAQQWAQKAAPPLKKYAVLMGQLVKRESGGRLNATNHNTNGTVDHGPLQVNDVWRNDPVVGPLLASGRIYTVDGAITAGQRIIQKQGLTAWATHNPALDAQYIGRPVQGGSSLGGSAAAAPLSIPAPATSSFDSAGFQQAQRRSLLGNLIAKDRGTGGVLFRTGLLSTTQPNASDFLTAPLGAVRETAIPATGHLGTSPITAPGSAPDTLRAEIERANQINSKHFNYEWGGGHNAAGTPTHGVGHGSGAGIGFDCSGAVAKVLGINPMVASQFESYGAAGPGKQVTIYAKGTHVIMEIAGHFFGTSGANPGGGAGWIPRSALSSSYLAGFVARHPVGQ